MVNGSSLPTSIVPSCTLSNMPGLGTGSARSSWISEHSTRHPHPLRSHSSEMLPTLRNYDSTSQLLGQESTSATPVSGLSRSSTLHSTKTHRHRRSLSQHHISDAPTYGISPLPTHPALRSPVQEGFSDCALAGAGRGPHNQPNDFPVVPSRPPLRPTVSFGGISRFSYYSDISTEMEQKSKEVSAIEEKEVAVKFDAAAPTSQKPLAFLVVLCLLASGMGLSTTSLATALPNIAKDLKFSSVQSFWLVASYMTAHTLSQLIARRCAELIGSNPVMLLACLAYSVGSIIGALAPGLPGLIIARCIEGAGSGTYSALTPVIIHQFSRSLDQGKSMRIVSIAYWFSAALGPAVGGAMASTTGWRGIFCLISTFALMGLLSMPFVLLPPESPSSRVPRIDTADYFGWLLLAASFVAVAISLSWAGTLFAWTSWHVLAPLLIGLIGAAAWTQHSRLRADSITHFAKMPSVETILGCLGNAILGSMITTIIYTMPLFLMTVQGHSPAHAGLAVGSWTFSMAVTAIISMFIPAMLDTRLNICMCWIVLLVGAGLMTTLEQDTAAAVYIPVGLFSGMAMSILYSHLSAPQSDNSTKTSRPQDFCHTMGQALGVVVGSCVFLNVLHQTQPILYIPDAVALVATHPTDARVLAAYAVATRGTWIFLCAIASLAFLISAASAASSYFRRSSSLSLHSLK